MNWTESENIAADSRGDDGARCFESEMDALEADPAKKTEILKMRISKTELAALDEIATKLLWTRSQVVRQALIIGLPALRKRD